MEKVVVLLWGDGGAESGDALRDRLLGEPVPALVASGVRGLGVNVHDADAAPAPSPAPPPSGEDPHVAQVSVWLDSYEHRAEVEAAVDDLGLRWASYLVAESLYED